jgi:hypothetical protein
VEHNTGIVPVLRGDIHTRSSGDQLDLALAAHRSVGDREGQPQVRDIALVANNAVRKNRLTEDTRTKQYAGFTAYHHATHTKNYECFPVDIVY